MEVNQLPPQNLDAEKEILGAVLLDPEYSIPVVFELLNIDDFYLERHRIIFQAISILVGCKQEVTTPTVREKLKELELLDKAGGTVYLSGLTIPIATAKSVKYFADIVKECSRQREVLKLTQELSQGIFSSGEALEKLNQAAKNISDKQPQGFENIEPLIDQEISKIENVFDGRAYGESGILSGIYDLDRNLHGWLNGGLNFIVGRPGMGKSSLMRHLVLYAAVIAKKHVGIMSIEMPKTEMVQGLLFCQAKVPIEEVIFNQRVTKEELENLIYAAEQIRKSSVWIDDDPDLTVAKIYARTAKLKNKGCLDILFIDYLQLMKGTVGLKHANRVAQIGEMTSDLKKMAKSLNIPIVCLAQVNRECDQRNPPLPKISDCRESGNIEQDADRVILLYRYGDDMMRIELGKNRQGRTGIVWVGFDAKWTGVHNLDTSFQFILEDKLFNRKSKKEPDENYHERGE